jgi:hypothetical protein
MFVSLNSCTHGTSDKGKKREGTWKLEKRRKKAQKLEKCCPTCFAVFSRYTFKNVSEKKKKKKIDFNQNALVLEFGKTLFGLTS